MAWRVLSLKYGMMAATQEKIITHYSLLTTHCSQLIRISLASRPSVDVRL